MDEKQPTGGGGAKSKDVLNKMSRTSRMSQQDPKDTKECSARKVTKTIVTSPEIYPAVGPYSQAILADKTLYVSGILGLDADGQIVCGGAEAQTRQLLNNMKHVLEAGGASLESVIKTTILLADINDFKSVNQVYAECTRDIKAKLLQGVSRQS